MRSSHHTAPAATISVLLCGVGGQGTILAADVLAKVAAAYGYDVRLSEIHGMAQRGGSVSTIVRFGDEVLAPVIDAGSADLLVSFEVLEALRSLHFLKKDGLAVVNDTIIEPIAVATGAARIEGDPRAALRSRQALLIPATEIAAACGSPKSANIVLLGALSTGLPFEESLWHQVIEQRVPPRTLSGNLEAFAQGRAAIDRKEDEQ